MIQKKYVKTRDVCKVTFKIPASELPEELEVETVAVIGTFNDWNPNTHPMKLTKKGVFQTDIDLEPNQTFAFRYIANGQVFFNAWEADGYEPNGYGDDNCVLETAV
jgi:1,4-alpha-glucan branching enzyme